MTPHVEAPPEFQMSEPVAKRYRQYMQDNHGEIDVPRLAECMWNAGARSAVASMTAMSDILPLINRIEGRIISLRSLLESFLDTEP